MNRKVLRFRFLKIIAAILLVTVLFSSCKEKITDAIKKELEAGDESITEANFESIAVDSLYALSIPKYMKEMQGLSDQATLQYGNKYKNLYTTVIHEDKQDFIDYFKEIGTYNDSLSVLANYVPAQVAYFKESVVHCEVEPLGMLKIKEYAAEQYQFYGSVHSQKNAYLITYIETKGDLFLIMSWTPYDRLSRFNETFKAIHNSFEYILNVE